MTDLEYVQQQLNKNSVPHEVQVISIGTYRFQLHIPYGYIIFNINQNIRRWEIENPSGIPSWWYDLFTDMPSKYSESERTEFLELLQKAPKI